MTRRIAPFPDAELDNLPPWRGDEFDRPATTLTFERAVQFFRAHFTDLDDPRFLRQEKQYKLAAHRRYVDGFAQQAAAWIANGDAHAIAKALDFVYGPHGSKPDDPESRLNLMFRRIDEPAFFDALSTGGPATVEFASSLLAFVGKPNTETFDNYAEALSALPPRRDGTQMTGWSVATWLPFIADPANHLVIKPTVLQSMGSAVAFHIPYQSQLNYRTYSSAVIFAKRMGEILFDSLLNPTRRDLDMMDVQSFMWVVAKYTDKDTVL